MSGREMSSESVMGVRWLEKVLGRVHKGFWWEELMDTTSG